jgi:hypothetical protein
MPEGQLKLLFQLHLQPSQNYEFQLNWNSSRNDYFQLHFRTKRKFSRNHFIQQPLQLITEPKARTENFLIWMDFEFIDRFPHNSLRSDSITLEPIPLIRDNLSAINGQEKMAKICFPFSCGTGDLVSLQHVLAGWAVTQTCWIFWREKVDVLWRSL